MNKLSKQLLKAHVAFELEQWQDDQLEARIREEGGALMDWLEQLPLGQIADPDNITSVALDLLHNSELDDEALARVSAIAQHLIGLPVNDSTSVGDLIDDELFSAGVDLSLELRHLRDTLLAEALASPVYKLMITEILYNGIRDFLTGEGSVTQKVAGMSGIIGKSAKSIGKRLSALDEKVEVRVRAYVENNAANNVENSRDFLERTLTDARVREVADLVWSDLRNSPLSIHQLLQDGDVEAIAEFLRRGWQELRTTAYVEELVREAIQDAFRNWADLPVATLLYQAGMSRDTLLEAAIETAPAAFRAAREQGTLQAFLERRLGAFYQSDNFQQAMDS